MTFVDDITGEVADETVRFGFEGAAYEIDLAAGNAAKLREAVAPFVDAARRGRRDHPAKTTARPGRAGREQTQAVREWARKHGHKIADRGRIPGPVMAAFAAAH